MSIKVNWLIVFLFCSVANAADNFRITEDGLYSKDGKLLNSEISTKSTTFSYSLRENAGGVITLYRDAFLNSSNGQCAMQFKKNQVGEYRALYAICFDEIVSIKENQRVPALKFVSLNNVDISNYKDAMTSQGEYSFGEKVYSDVVLFDVSQNKTTSMGDEDKVYCNYYVRDGNNVAVSTDSIRCYRRALVKNKTYLYDSANAEGETKKYLISGDNVIPLDEKIDHKNNKWVYVLYQGKKDTKMWVDGDALSLSEQLR